MNPFRGATHRRGGGGSGSDRGSATILMVAVIGVVLLCLTGALALLSAVGASHRARAAADLAALAGARALVDGDSRVPCDVAASVAARNGGSVVACVVVGDDITVSVATPASWPGLGTARARARAGPDSGELRSSAAPPGRPDQAQTPPRFSRHHVAWSPAASSL